MPKEVTPSGVTGEERRMQTTPKLAVPSRVTTRAVGLPAVMVTALIVAFAAMQTYGAGPDPLANFFGP